MNLPPRNSGCTDLTTEDNRTPIVEGMMLFNYYDGEWGKVVFNSYTHEDGWFSINGTSLNGVRVSTYDPKGSQPPKLFSNREVELLASLPSETNVHGNAIWTQKEITEEIKKQEAEDVKIQSDKCITKIDIFIEHDGEGKRVEKYSYPDIYEDYTVENTWLTFYT